MNNQGFWIYLLIISGSTYLIRTIPFASISKKIKNRFIRSFLYYIPYTVLSAMTFPAALYATGNIIAASAGLAVAILFAVKGKSLTVVAAVSCLTVFVVGQLINIV
ncbi:MAG: AzlD domain-containing protein [Ruminococcaceae bacterium]|nr:AzlD domain-containing protein [Oscillospiraceae bacterium]